MKLVIAIIHDDDAPALLEELHINSFRVTKLASTGGFLKAGNTTLLIGTKKELVDDVLNIIKKTCDTRTEITAANTVVGGSAGSYMTMPIEVTVGGATVFVVDIEKHMKV